MHGEELLLLGHHLLQLLNEAVLVVGNEAEVGLLLGSVQQHHHLDVRGRGGTEVHTSSLQPRTGRSEPRYPTIHQLHITHPHGPPFHRQATKPSELATYAAVAHDLAEPLEGFAGLEVELDGADVLEVHLAYGADDCAVDELHHQLVGPVVRLAAGRRYGGGLVRIRQA